MAVVYRFKRETALAGGSGIITVFTTTSVEHFVIKSITGRQHNGVTAVYQFAIHPLGGFSSNDLMFPDQLVVSTGGLIQRDLNIVVPPSNQFDWSVLNSPAPQIGFHRLWISGILVTDQP